MVSLYWDYRHVARLVLHAPPPSTMATTGSFVASRVAAFTVTKIVYCRSGDWKCGSITAVKGQSSSLQHLPVLDVGCIVYVYKKELMDLVVQQLSALCTVELSLGFWTHHMLKVGRGTTNVAPALNSTTSYTSPNGSARLRDDAACVAILMDDINVQSVQLPRLVHTMQQAHLDVVVPAIPGGVYKDLLPQDSCTAHETGHVDMLLTIFTMAAWQCWQQHINVSMNAHGWGYDATLADVCGVRIGVVNHETLYHEANCPAGTECPARTYDTDRALAEMHSWIQAAMGVPYTAAYFHYVAYERPAGLPYVPTFSFVRDNDIAWTAVLKRQSASYLSHQ
jgi:Protein of unknown function (DUF707)